MGDWLGGTVVIDLQPEQEDAGTKLQTDLHWQQEVVLGNERTAALHLGHAYLHNLKNKIMKTAGYVHALVHTRARA